MKHFFYTIFFLCFFISCDNLKPEISTEIIRVRVFSFTKNKNEIFNAQKKVIKTSNEYSYIYNFDKHNDTLKFIKDNIYFKGKKLKEIDTKDIVINGNYYSVSKCFFENKKDFRGDKYLFINKELGLIFVHDSYGNMYEYDIKKYKFLHKNIALNRFNFKNGDFEIKYLKMDYPKLKD